MKYEDLQHLESEEKSQRGRNGLPPAQSLLQHLYPGPGLLLLSLGLSLLLLVVICVVGSQNSKFQRDLLTLRTTFSNFTSNTSAEVQALTSQGNSLQETVTSLKAKVEDHKQELQATHSLEGRVLSLESRLEKQEQELKAGHSEMLLHVQQLVKDLNSLTCQVAFLKSNGSERTCCPTNWVEHSGSCYWFSSSGKPWPEAEKYCQLENSHLVVINSQEEQNFVQGRLGRSYTWMGLSDPEGVWKWVDGTEYKTNFQNWKPGQPDDWQGHGLGGGEDCAHFLYDGRWNDDVCQRSYHWVCEAGLTQESRESH
ncbi:C-type lectin domain family 10 member A [Otolemur garnettii]|uniref:C-type lectin domain family 10 member A n=1 Tax=Otolemur garnettii TaxID=30611 RepID=UPI000C7F4618|nr:C-type lectin domain family 10 member A [Otolemur garnettii]XP_023369716.1 C-type lectin domain family 10 member A [Otolemur garnettii]XP_023369717.1 C-type lectin domain family 10 member A [Otolemur garnettii]